MPDNPISIMKLLLVGVKSQDSLLFFTGDQISEESDRG